MAGGVASAIWEIGDGLVKLSDRIGRGICVREPIAS